MNAFAKSKWMLFLLITCSGSFIPRAAYAGVASSFFAQPFSFEEGATTNLVLELTASPDPTFTLNTASSHSFHEFSDARIASYNLTFFSGDGQHQRVSRGGSGSTSERIVVPFTYEHSGVFAPSVNGFVAYNEAFHVHDVFFDRGECFPTQFGSFCTGGKVISSDSFGRKMQFRGIFTSTLVDVAAPIPEPEIYAMMIAGLSLLGFVARRKKGQAVVA